MKLKDVKGLGTNRAKIPESERNAEQETKPAPLTREQVAAELAKRGIRLRNAPPSPLVGKGRS
jgi:hypothetical protein